MSDDNASLCSRDVGNNTRSYRSVNDGDYSISLDIKDNKMEYTPSTLDTETKVTEVKVTSKETNEKERED